ncbi:MAG: Asp-tRNA(Asn)/Glu-tRNA(Gln) amidotransferase subunit GatB [Gemmatimonadetes bacterium]|nr:Asp-tRNA(Asn)/Glu-tRNA(Gln) amidotransferase subunit GatB [Gemmatimonadota bacterium]
MFEPVIGLEIHVQLKTATKMFCGNAAEYGALPNTHVCPVCLGLPGALPVINEHAVRLGARAALGVHCEVHEESIFARKNYFYPDLPKGYQITQFDRPIATNGWLDVPGEGVPTRVRIRRIHLEEDAGKSLHDRIPGATAVDLNRAGTPLVEIVTEPDIRSPAEARAFLVQLKRALEYLEVSDCNMEEGSLRVDANVSIRLPGEDLGPKTEVKNMNSFSNVERAIHFEIGRQIGLRERGGAVEHQTMLWDAGRGEARPMRSKEESHDYRYFPEPDLPPLRLDSGRIGELREALPEMPWARQARFGSEHKLSTKHAELLTASRPLADYYEAVVSAGVESQEAANWVMGDVLAAVNAGTGSIDDFAIRPAPLAELLSLLSAGTITRPVARQVFARMAQSGKSARSIVDEEGLAQVRDDDALQRWVAEVIAESPGEVERFRGGDAKLMGFFVGKVMKLSGGKADPKQVNTVIREKLNG